MPELPEVQTTVDGLNKRVASLTITDVLGRTIGVFFISERTI